MAFFGDYRPATFGWVQAGPMVPFAYRGVPFPGGVSALPGVAVIFTRVLDLLVPHIPGGLVAGQCWGFANRAKRTDASSTSFHAFGIAIDVNAPENPQARTHRFGGPHELPANTGVIVRPWGVEWGGNWSLSTPPDYMHLELHLSPAEARILGAAAVHGHTTRAPAPALRWTPWVSTKPGERALQLGDQGTDVTALQRVLNAWYPSLTPQLARDGQYGPATVSRVKYFQTHARLRVDGLCDVQTWKALGF